VDSDGPPLPAPFTIFWQGLGLDVVRTLGLAGARESASWRVWEDRNIYRKMK
jgi:hypothetical protein